MSVLRKTNWSDGDLAIASPPAEILRLKRSDASPLIGFLDLSFDALSTEEAGDEVMHQAARNASFVYVATPNVDHRVRLEREPELKPLYDAAWMTLCDSRIIALLARMDGLCLPATPGADLVAHLFETRIRSDMAINVIGSSARVIELIKARYSIADLRWHEAPMDMRYRPDAIARAAEFVARNPAPLTFICVGSPQQELVARAISLRGDAKGVGLCCGASLEFLSGVVSRAPRWVRHLALEWLHRLATNPIRFGRRYLIDGPAIFPIWLAWRERLRTELGVLENGLTTRGGEAVSIHPVA